MSGQSQIPIKRNRITFPLKKTNKRKHGYISLNLYEFSKIRFKHITKLNDTEQY